MSFRLLIECSKDLDSLKINFSDGTSVVQTVKEESTEQSILHSRIENEERPKTQPMTGGGFLDTDADFGTISSDVIEKPDVTQPNREISVASELQNLDI